jgi:hypothetical protein
LKTIFGSERKPDRVLYFCESDIPVYKRHKLQQYCWDTYSASLEIFDGQAIATLLPTMILTGLQMNICISFRSCGPVPNEMKTTLTRAIAG